MELWFMIAILGSISAGVSNFFFKVAAAKNYDAELFIFYGAAISIPLAGIPLLLWPEPTFSYGFVVFVLLGSGFIAATSGSMKVYVLRYIDSTIYFPLFKLLTPALAIVAGVTFFRETFSPIEWVGLIVGLLVPLMLITPAENTRQQNLKMGLLFILITSVISAMTAVAGKYAIEVDVPVFSTFFLTVLGLSLGAVTILIYKRGVKGIWTLVKRETNTSLVSIAVGRAVLISFGVWAMLFAYSQGGTLSVVQTIHSMYILIPIVLAIIFYNEHWNLQKVAAIVLSVASIGLLG